MRRSILGGLALITSLTISGCGDGDPAALPPSSTPSGSASASATEQTPTLEASPAESGPTAVVDNVGDTYAEFTPTDGTVVGNEVVAVNAPADWPGEPTTSRIGSLLVGPDPRLSVSAFNTEVVTPRSLNELVASERQFGEYAPGVKRLDDVVVDGYLGYHLAGDNDFTVNFVDTIGFEGNGVEVTLRIGTPRELSRAERDDYLGSVMASFRFVS